MRPSCLQSTDWDSLNLPDFCIVWVASPIPGCRPIGREQTRDNRLLGAASADGNYADIYALEWIEFLRRKLAPECLRLGISDLDSGALQRGSPRQLTQLASLEVYKLNFGGIYYRSRYGHNLENWAIFEPFPLNAATWVQVQADDPVLQKALAILGLELR